MTNIEQKIDGLREKVRENMTKRDDVYLILGQFLLSQPPETQESGLLEEQRSSAQAHFDKIPQLEGVLEELSQCEIDIRELKEAEADLKDRLSDCKLSMDQLQDTVGEELFHQLNTLDSPDWASAYQPVTDLINKIRENESDLFQAENQVSKKNLINNVMFKSRVSILKSKKKSMENALGKLYKKCFNEALNLGAGRSGDDSSTATLLIPWFRADEERKALLQEEEELENKKLLNRDHLKALSEGKGPKKRKDALLKEMSREQEHLKDSLIKLGEGVCGNLSDMMASRKEVADAIGKIDTLTESAVALNLEIEKWEARKDIEKLGKDKEYMSGKIATLEEEIQARRQEIKILKKDITKVSSEIEKKQTFTADLPEE
ncbi:MAG: hypothetical protein B6241_12190 [Spirochaetaceae bacterium 4572_59]|nr:MAG: hypothetical protein B6241_12190 [Spirochaetaceae bacterium 4572_59]